MPVLSQNRGSGEIGSRAGSPGHLIWDLPAVYRDDVPHRGWFNHITQRALRAPMFPVGQQMQVPGLDSDYGGFWTDRALAAPSR